MLINKKDKKFKKKKKKKKKSNKFSKSVMLSKVKFNDLEPVSG